MPMLDPVLTLLLEQVMVIRSVLMPGLKRMLVPVPELILVSKPGIVQ